LLVVSWVANGRSQSAIDTYAGGGPNNLPALEANLFNPSSVAIDASGNFFIASLQQHRVFKVDPSGQLTVVAGTGLPGFGGDNGPAASASLNVTEGVAVVSAGNLYIADAQNHRIRFVNLGTATVTANGQTVAPGQITTVAGSGVGGFSGDSGPATSARVNRPQGVSVDNSGNLFIADTNNHRIRQVDTAGNITTVAGTGTAGFSGDGGAPASARLNLPEGVFVDSTGNLFISDTSNFRIRKVSGGIITTVAGGGSTVVDNVAATSSRLVRPAGVAVDNSGNFYIADSTNNRIRKVDTTGIITTAAGTGNPNFNGDGAATSVNVTTPQGVAVDSAGNLYIADTQGNRIRKVSGAALTTVAGNGLFFFSGNGVAATNASLHSPWGMALDSAGTLYFADADNHRVRQVDSSTGKIFTVAGTGEPAYSGDGGAATSARLNTPQGVAVDSTGTLYFADTGNHRVRKVSGGIITTVAGTGSAGSSGDGGPATSARLSGPRGVAVDSGGNLYIADTGNHRIRFVNLGTATVTVNGQTVAPGQITTVAGTGSASFSGDGGPATSAGLNSPQGLAVDGSGNLYIAETSSMRIRFVNLGSTTVTVNGQTVASGAISTVAGNGTSGFSGDEEPAISASLLRPAGVAVDGAGNLYIADTENHRVRKVDPAGTITTLAGTGIFSPFGGDGGPATSASLAFPRGVAFAGISLYIADTSNERIRRMMLGNTPAGTNITVQPVDPATGASPVTLTFSQVTQAGDTSLETSTDGPTPPKGFRHGSPRTYYYLNTTTAFSGPVNLGINYSGIRFINNANLALFHFNRDLRPKKLLIYYGLPSEINGSAGSISAAAGWLGSYDYVVLVEGLELMANSEHPKTEKIIKYRDTLKQPPMDMRSTKVFGYIDLGVYNDGDTPPMSCNCKVRDEACKKAVDDAITAGKPRNFCLEEIDTRLGEWKAMGAEGILFDEFGYSRGVTRTRQNDAVKLARDKGMVVVANTSDPDAAFGNQNDPRCLAFGNSKGCNADGEGDSPTPTLLNASDFYLYESHQILEGNPVKLSDWQTKANKLRGYQYKIPFKIFSVTTTRKAAGLYDNDKDKRKFFYSWYSALMYGHEATGWGELDYSAPGGLSKNSAPYRNRPTDDNPGLNPGGCFTRDVPDPKSGPNFYRDTNRGQIYVKTPTQPPPDPPDFDYNFNPRSQPPPELPCPTISLLDLNGSWQDVTVSQDPVNRMIRGRVSAFSPFAIFEEENQPPLVSANSPSVAVNEGSAAANSGTFSDPDPGDTVSLSASAGAVVQTGSGTWGWSLDAADGPSQSQTVTITATDNTGASAATTFTLTVNNVPPSIAGVNLSASSIAENGSVTLSGLVADPGTLDGQTVTINWGDGSTNSTIVLTPGVSNFGASHQYPDDAPTNTASDAYPITISAIDKDGGTGSVGTSVTVTNAAPVISGVTGPTNPLALGTSATVTATFTDPGTQDTHSCTFSWDNGQPATAGSISESAGSGSCTATRTYTAAGVYTVAATVTDDDTGSATKAFEFVVVYDPSGGFVTGGGWINSPPGAYKADTTSSGKANFGFVSKYQKGSTTPTGETEFHAAGLDFHSTIYEWLVISGAKAQYKGTGTVNGSLGPDGVSGYGFLLTTNDGQLTGGGGVDKFRIKIWDKLTGAVVYDNVLDPTATDNIDNAKPQNISGGNILIHK
jgi:sugar lactone lactonase YvrE